MAETITAPQGAPMWTWYHMMQDLEDHGAAGVTIDPTSISPDGYGKGEFRGNGFHFTWAHEKFLLVTMDQYDQVLVDAFTAILEYSPIYRYNSRGKPTVEWNMVDVEDRWAEIQHDNRLTDAIRLDA